MSREERPHRFSVVKMPETRAEEQRDREGRASLVECLPESDVRLSTLVRAAIFFPVAAHHRETE